MTYRTTWVDDEPDWDDPHDGFTWLDCDNPNCTCHRRPIDDVPLPAEDVTR